MPWDDDDGFRSLLGESEAKDLEGGSRGYNLIFRRGYTFPGGYGIFFEGALALFMTRTKKRGGGK